MPCPAPRKLDDPTWYWTTSPLAAHVPHWPWCYQCHPTSLQSKASICFSTWKTFMFYIYIYGPIYIYITYAIHGTFNLWWLLPELGKVLFLFIYAGMIHLCTMHLIHVFFNMPGTIPSLWSTRKFQTQKKMELPAWTVYRAAVMLLKRFIISNGSPGAKANALVFLRIIFSMRPPGFSPNNLFGLGHFLSKQNAGRPLW